MSDFGDKGELQSLVDVGDNSARDNILSFEELLKNVDGSVQGDSDICPLKHSFSENIYVREISIPKGMFIVGKIHKHEHPNFLLKGDVVVFTENDGEEHLSAPCSMISKGGTKRALYSKTDLVWTTVHHNPTNTRDLNELEKLVIADSYGAYEKYLHSTKSIGSKIKNLIIKTLSK